MIYHLGATPATTAALAADRAALLTRRIAALAAQRGYVVGAGGIAVHNDGSVTIDADRDPSADWAAFNPEARTPEEIQEAAFLEALRTWIATLEAGGSLTAAQRRALDLRLLRTMERELRG